MHSILKKIVDQKIEDLVTIKKNHPLHTLQRAIELPIRPFIEAIKQHDPAIIAEIKRTSPSQGSIRRDIDIPSIAQTYETHGAACLSVLTEEHFFHGSAQDLILARKSCTLPVLRKDFVINEYQIYESHSLGADCILLIVAILDDQQLHDYCTLAKELGLAVLVESHNLEELHRALRLSTPLMGINNRDLHHFVTDIACSIQLSTYIPKDKIAISESGIKSHHDIKQLKEHGIHAFLIGEHLMRSESIGIALQELIR